MRARQIATIGAAGFGLALLLSLLDPVLEGDVYSTRALVADIVDKSLLVGVMIACALIVLRVSRLEEDAQAMRHDLGVAQAEGRVWREKSRNLVAGLSGAIEEQFSAWGLTKAEADIAGLMLKGASLKQIAALRQTSQTTIRQQAQSVYRKAGLSGRAELSAFFLEDLLSVAETALPEERPVPSVTPLQTQGPQSRSRRAG